MDIELKNTTNVQRRQMFEEAQSLAGIFYGSLDGFSMQQVRKYICGEQELEEAEHAIYHAYRTYGECGRREMPLWDNSLYIYDKKILTRLHAAMVTVNIMKLDALSAAEMDLEYYLFIHRQLYGRIYPWAGEIRDIDMDQYVCPLRYRYKFFKAKNVRKGLDDVFAGVSRVIDRNNIEGALCSVFTRIDIHKWNRLDEREKIARLVASIGNMWRIHPFLHGNGLTELYFIVRLCERLGMSCKRSAFGEYKGGKRLEQCMILAYYDPNGLGRIVYRAVSDKKYQEEKKVQSGNLHEKYSWTQAEEIIAERKQKKEEADMLKLREADLSVGGYDEE